MDEKALMEAARQARKLAYAPYSGFFVGAALLTKGGKVYTGCNIENASYGGTNCAERTAFYKAISEGEREFAAIAIVGGRQVNKAEQGKVEYHKIENHGMEECETTSMCAPCGICRQVMMEFCDPESFQILLEGEDGEVVAYLLKDLLPLGFGQKNLVK